MYTTFVLISKRNEVRNLIVQSNNANELNIQ